MTVTQTAREALAACRGVEVRYGEGESAVHALAGVDLEIRPRESLALLGRSGSGKTTLLHVLGGLVEPSGGVVEWRGRPLASLDRAARGAVRAHGIAYVFQGANLLPHFTAVENVAFAAHLAGDSGARTGGVARARRPRGEGGQSAGGALGRRGPARRDRACACPAAGADALRRADRASRL